MQRALERATSTLHAADCSAERLAEAMPAARLVGALTDDITLAAGVLLHEAAAGKPPDKAPAGFEVAAFVAAHELTRLGDFGGQAQWRDGARLDDAQAEVLRKMLLAIVADPRLVVARIGIQLARLRAAKTLPELIEWSKTVPGGVRYSSGGHGGSNHLAGELIADQRGLTVYAHGVNARGQRAYRGAVTCPDGVCIDAQWRPFIAAAGARAVGSWGLAKLQDGRLQWTYKGQKLYTNALDQKPGEFKGIRFGGDRSWSAIMRSGEPMQGVSVGG
ncbi:MAG: HD domain-containing protein [Gammaproteobacteria bacterium]|nr:HD domain-containing protein [Gammaproteobacteria bacterium]